MRAGAVFRRTGILCALGALASLLLLFGIDPLVSIPVRRALRNIDPEASAGEISFGGGVVLLKDLELPGRGLRLESSVVYWSGNILSPSVDSLLVLGGDWTPVRERVSPGTPSPGSGIPPVRFAGVRLSGGTETAFACGTVESTATGRSVSLSIEGDWGSLTGTILSAGGRDSFSIDWFSVERIPADIITVPVVLRDMGLQGCMTAVRTDHIIAEGTITAVNGDPSDIAFFLDGSRDRPFISLSSGMEDIREILISGAAGLLGDVYMDMEPSGRFTVEVVDSDTVGVVVDAVLEQVRIYSPGLAEDTVSFSAALAFRGTACTGTREVSIDSGLAVIGDLAVNFDLRGRFSGGTRLDLRIWNDSLDGEVLARSVPRGLLGSLSGLELSGNCSFDVLMALDWGCPDSSDFHADVDVRGLRVVRSPVSVGQLRYGGSCLMRDSWGGSSMIYLDTMQNPRFMVFDSLHPSFEGLLRCAEDATFRSHSGFCEYHIRNSIRANMESGRFARGGSTITMQLARNLFLGREKTLARKVQEVFLTWRLESYLSKNRMLEIYANVVELGPGVFGFGEAADYYFGRDFRHLTTRQVAYLVSILPGPRLYHGFFSARRVPGHWEAYLDRLLRISSERGWIDRDSALGAMSDSIVFAPARGSSER